MNCLACKQPNDPGRNYCGGCGLPLARYCAGCGFRNGAADRFCGGCGVGLEAVSGAGALPAAVASAASPSAPSPAAPAPGAPPGLADLLEAARESVETAAEEADVKVSQDDIDTLFGV